MKQGDVTCCRYDGAGFAPQVFFGDWRVAYLNHQPSQERGKVSFVERHHETDEIFVLLEGTATLLLAGAGQTAGPIEELEMERGLIYNIAKDVWHAIITAPDSRLLIVENGDTGEKNSSYETISNI